jgi:hypothetical protein
MILEGAIRSIRSLLKGHGDYLRSDLWVVEWTVLPILDVNCDRDEEKDGDEMKRETPASQRESRCPYK